jgi:hypothetical protein
VGESEQDQVAFGRRCRFAWRTGTAARGRLRLGCIDLPLASAISCLPRTVSLLLVHNDVVSNPL